MDHFPAKNRFSSDHHLRSRSIQKGTLIHHQDGLELYIGGVGISRQEGINEKLWGRMANTKLQKHS
jgi:hypothetical protein